MQTLRSEEEFAETIHIHSPRAIRHFSTKNGKRQKRDPATICKKVFPVKIIKLEHPRHPSYSFSIIRTSRIGKSSRCRFRHRLFTVDQLEIVEPHFALATSGVVIAVS